MSQATPHRYVLRAVIEFTTPFLIGAGRGGGIADAVFVADANGLPAIPGSSLAGVLRSAFRSRVNDLSAEQRLFGFQQGQNGAGSRLVVSWGVIHDSRDLPVEGIIPPARLDDPVLTKALSPAIRDHVRLNHRGASDAAERGKFDEQAVCAGHRFTFELELQGDGDDQPLWDTLLAVLADPTLRLGGKTRRGYGAFRLVSLWERVFDLGTDFAAYREHPAALAQPSPVLRKRERPATPRREHPTIEIQLQPTGYWMFGGGHDLATDPGDSDMAPVRDCRIEWSSGQGTVSDDLLVIPATGVKGALAHRVAFHYNALTGVFADEPAADNPLDVTGENNPAVRLLFGYCKGRSAGADGDERETGQRGRVVIDDLYIPPPAAPTAQLVHHVGLDRFTGGARDQVLFAERPLWRGNFPRLDLHIINPDAIQDRHVFGALELAVRDLTEGRLQLGAGSGRGLGTFTGTYTWPAQLNG